MAAPPAEPAAAAPRVELSPAQRMAARRIIAAKLAGNLADLLANAKTTIPWMMQAAGAPPLLISMAVPIRESGSMLPQLWLSRVVRRATMRKWVSVFAALGQAFACLLMAAAAWQFKGWTSGAGVLGGLALLALMRAMSSIAGKDVLGRSVPKGARGRVTGLATSLAGGLGVAGSIVAMFAARGGAPAWIYPSIVGSAALAFAGAALCFASVGEVVPDKAQQKPVPNARLAMIWREPPLRRFVLARTLLLGSALGAPYLVLFGRQDSASLAALAAFVLAGGGASALSSWAWGRIADAHGEHSMFYGGALAAFVGALALSLRFSFPAGSLHISVWAGLYFVFSIGYAGVRVGRKTYIVDIAGGDQRTAYVASSNTAIAIALLAFGAIGAGLHSVSAWLALFFFVVCTAAGAAMSLKLEGTPPGPA